MKQIPIQLIFIIVLLFPGNRTTMISTLPGQHRHPSMHSPVPVCPFAMYTASSIQGSAEPLPEGPGLASGYPGDKNILRHPSVVFADDFEHNEMANHWDHVWANRGESRIVHEAVGVHSGSGAYMAHIDRPADSPSSVGARKFLLPGHDTLFFRYYARFSTDAELFHGGTHNAASIAARRPGELYESYAGVYATGDNLYSIILDTWRPDTTVASPGEMAFYCYHMHQGHRWGDHFFPSGRVLPGGRDLFGEAFIPRKNFIPEQGRWYCYELMIIANTPGKRNGRAAFWVDGRLTGDFPNLEFRNTAELKPNRIAFQLYTHNTQIKGDVTLWFDDAVAATSYIGPRIPSGNH